MTFKYTVVRLLFILLVAIEDFSLTLRRHYYGFRVSDLDLCSALTAIAQ